LPVNREMRRLQAKEEERAKKRRQQGPAQRRNRVSAQQFVREVRQEMKKVAWPTRKELTTFTVVVFITTTSLTGLTFGLDWGLRQAFLKILGT